MINAHRIVQTGTWAPAAMRVHALWAACSDAGCSIDGTRKTNQDSYLVDAPRSGELLIGVFDGHGEHGHHVSQQCKTQFADMLRTASQSHPNLQSATTAAYVEQDHACTLALDCSQSGTTAVTCHLQGDELSGQVTITTAWAGDSRAVLAQVKPCGGVVTRDLSVDQKPERPDEKARIEKFGGVCEPVFDVRQLVERLAGRPTDSGPGQPRSPPRRSLHPKQLKPEATRDRVSPLLHQERGLPCGPMRVWYLAQVAPGLAMSRSIGDAVGAMVGVTAEPEVSQVVLGPEASFVLVCSDGIWEFLESRGAAGGPQPGPP